MLPRVSAQPAGSCFSDCQTQAPYLHLGKSIQALVQKVPLFMALEETVNELIIAAAQERGPGDPCLAV